MVAHRVRVLDQVPHATDLREGGVPRPQVPRGSNIREFLNKLREDCELLLQSGVEISYQDFVNVILHLPSQMDIKVRRPAPCFDEEPGDHDGRIHEHAR